MADTQIRGGGTKSQIKAGTITDTEISASAAIANSKLAGSPTASNTANTIALRDANGRTQMADPSAAQDVATKAYVDGLINGVDAKASVRVATTANITLSGTQTIDGVALSVGDRVLVKDQSTGSQNGIYAVAAGAWSRTTDADANAEVTAGMYVFVTEGTSNADTGWLLTTNDAIVVGTTALTFTQFTGAGQVIAGAGLTKTGNTIDIGAGNGITVNADSIETIYGASGDMVASAVGDTVSVGTANKAARADHKHAREGFGTPGNSFPGDNAATGSAVTVARSDHVHNREWYAGENFTGDGSTTTFNFYNQGYQNQVDSGSIKVYLNGLRQRGSGNDYSYYPCLGPTEYCHITFVSAPATGDWILVEYAGNV